MTNNRRCLENATPELAVFASALASIIWSATLALPGDSMAGPDFHYMNLFGGDRIWAIAFGAIAVLQLWRIAGRTQRESYRFAVVTDLLISFVAAGVWTFVTGLCLLNSWPPSPYAGSTAVLAAGLWWDFLEYNPQHLRKPKAKPAELIHETEPKRVAVK